MLLLMAFVVFVAVAQLPDDLRTEQIYLAPSCTWFDAGDSVRVDGVVTSIAHHRTAPYSRYLYLEMIGLRDSVLVRQRVACDSIGRFRAVVPTSDLLPDGMYYLRAYTALMRNFSNEGFAYAPLICGARPADDSASSEGVRCQVAPEGGGLVPGVVQKVVVSLRTMSGRAIADRVITLIGDDGTEVSSATTSSSGMATLSFIPKPKEHYFVVAVGGEGLSAMRYAVPDAVPGGVKFEASLQGNTINYMIHNMPADKADLQIFTFDRDNGLLRCNGARQSGTIRLANVPLTSTIMLADAECNVLAEYTMMQRRQSDEKYVTAAEDTVSRGRPVGEEWLKTLLPGSTTAVMVRVVSLDDPWALTAEDALMYQSEYTSAIPYPTASWKCSQRERVADLQAWLSTACLARVTLKKAVEDINIYSHLPEMVMTLSGTVYNENLHPYKNGRVVVYRTDNNCVYDTIVGDDGKFCLAVDDFPEGTEFFVQYITKNEKLVKADIHFDDYTYPAVDKRERWTYASIYGESDKTVGLHSSLDNLHLPEITVKARARTDRSHETETFYSTGYKDRETIEEKNYFTLLDILRDIPQVVVRHSDSGYCLLSTRGDATLKKGGSNGNNKNSFGEFDESLNMSVADDVTAVSLPLIVDGSRYSGSQFDNAMNISAFEIESVEYLRPWQTLAVTFGAMQGAVVVTTRKYKGGRTVPSRGTYYRPQGLSDASGGDKHLRAPSSPGRYRVIIDAMDDGVVRSYNRVVQVR